MDIFVARQPIFDRAQQVIAYELLYRSGKADYYDATYGDQATSEVIVNSFILIGLDVLTEGKRAFVNFTENFLRNDVATILPKELMAIEILENIEVTDQIVEHCTRLKELGYMLVLDDFTLERKQHEKLISLVDIIKVDFKNTTKAERKKIISKFNNPNIKFLAEKVETQEEFKAAWEMGYSYFQGFYFSKPAIVSGKNISGERFNILQIMVEINRKDVELEQLENIIKRDISLSYKLLKYINSVSFGLRKEIVSIKDAIVFLGLKELKKWLTLIIFGILGDEKPNQLLKTSVVRARYAELLSVEAGLINQAPEAFLMGLFSSLDAVLDKSLEEILSELPISKELCLGLINKEGEIYPFVDFVLTYEKGDWLGVTSKAKEIGISESRVSELFFEALKWVNKYS